MYMRIDAIVSATQSAKDSQLWMADASNAQRDAIFAMPNLTALYV